MAVLTAAAMARVTIEGEKQLPIIISVCLALGCSHELFFEHLRRRELKSIVSQFGSRENADWRVCHPLTAPACIAGRHRRNAPAGRHATPFTMATARSR